MSNKVPQQFEDLVFIQPDECATCEFATPDSRLFCARNTALGSLAAINATLESTGYHNNTEITKLSEQIPELSIQAQNCADGMKAGEEPIEFRSAMDGVTFHVYDRSSH